ncbi:MAG: Fe-S-containing protein, partial [Deltaproteobacteria bacterium]|nr:Fe-S-containing protein [Deltaproteobacteria bacterium]
YRHCACIVLCLLISALNITVVRSYANREVEISPPLETFATDGKILLPIEKINDGNLHRFQYKTSGGTAVRYIVIKKSGTAYGVGLDACDICGASGYYQRKDQVICKLCDVVMNKSTIGFPGGCNPVPLRFGIAQGHMVIMAADLEAEKQRFQ